ARAAAASRSPPWPRLWSATASAATGAGSGYGTMSPGGPTPGGIPTGTGGGFGGANPYQQQRSVCGTVGAAATGTGKADPTGMPPGADTPAPKAQAKVKPRY